MDDVQVDITRITRLDVHKYGERITSSPVRGDPVYSSFRLGILKAGIAAAAKVSPTGMLFKEVLELTETARAVPVSFIGGSGPMIAPPRLTGYLTAAVGGSAVLPVNVSFQVSQTKLLPLVTAARKP